MKRSIKFVLALVLVLTFALTVIFDLVVAIITGLILHYVILLAKNLISKYKNKKSPDLVEENLPLNELVDTEDADVAFGSVEGLPLNQDDNSEL